MYTAAEPAMTVSPQPPAPPPAADAGRSCWRAAMWVLLVGGAIVIVGIVLLYGMCAGWFGGGGLKF